MRYLKVLGWAVVFTVTTLLFACATNDTRMSHSDPIIGPDVTMAQLTEEMAPMTEQEISFVARERALDQRERMLNASREETLERERMAFFLEDTIDRRENALVVNQAWLREKELQLDQREDELELRENALVLNRAWFEEQKARIADQEADLGIRENALAINQAWFKHQQMQFEHTQNTSEDILVLTHVDRNRCYATLVVPAEYLAVASEVMVQDQDDDEGIPAIYQTVTKHVKVSDERTSVEEVVCASELTDNKVRDIQRALSLHGHNAGPIDGVVGPRTMSAVKEFQKEHGLIVADYLTTETVETLGVKF